MLPNVLQPREADHVPVLAEEVRRVLAVRPGRDRRRRDLRRRRARRDPRRRPARPREADRDRPRPDRADVLRAAREAHRRCNARLLRGDFGVVLPQLAENGVRADAILLDLGVSSMQLDRPERGFSYAVDAPLDMRMDPTQDESARDVVNTWSERDLVTIFRRYGEERYAKQIARAIVRRRREQPFERTGELVDTIKGAIPAPARFGDGHPAKRVFQALRIAVNDELDSLASALARRARDAAARRPSRRHLVPLARGPDREAVPARAGARLHVPARLPGLRLRPRARAARAAAPADPARPGRARGEPALGVGAPARRGQDRGGGGLMAAVDWFAPAEVAEPAPPKRRRRPRLRTERASGGVRTLAAQGHATPRPRPHRLDAPLRAPARRRRRGQRRRAAGARRGVATSTSKRAQLQARNQTLASQLSAPTPRRGSRRRRAGSVSSRRRPATRATSTSRREAVEDARRQLAAPPPPPRHPPHVRGRSARARRGSRPCARRRSPRWRRRRRRADRPAGRARDDLRPAWARRSRSASRRRRDRRSDADRRSAPRGTDRGEGARDSAFEPLYRQLSDRSRGFVYVQRKAPPKLAAALEKRSSPASPSSSDERRVYPQGTVAAPVLGYAGIDNTGLSGLELELNKELEGTPGKRDRRARRARPGREHDPAASGRATAGTSSSRSTATSRRTPSRCSSRRCSSGTRRTRRRSSSTRTRARSSRWRRSRATTRTTTRRRSRTV